MIKIGVFQNIPDLTGLVRMLRKHPDVDIKWIYNFGRTFPVSHLENGLTGEYDENFIEKPDFDKIDLFIGEEITPELQEAFEKHDNLKVIFPKERLGCQNSLPSPKLIGIPEFNRKALVRGGRVAMQPDIITTLGALALMPLAKNLLLGNPIYGFLNLPDDSTSDPCSSPANGFLGQSATYYLREQILSSLQTSFNAPLNFMASYSDTNIAMATFSMSTNMNIADLEQIYHNFYDDHRHVVLTNFVSSRVVEGTNKAAISLNIADEMMFISVIFDCRYKNGSANIVHLINLLFGLDERTGI